MIKNIKRFSKNTNLYLRNLRYTFYLKFKNSSKEIVDMALFNKKYLGRENILTEIMNNLGSDKGNQHNYTDFYHFLFNKIRDQKLNIFEVGLGSVKLDFSDNMSKFENYSPLCSLRGWRKYFLNSEIFGADIDQSILNDEYRIKTFYVDMLKKETIKTMWKKIQKNMDIIIDDGMHSFNANIIFFENSINFLNNNGFYIIEDINRKPSNIKKYFKYFSKKNFFWQIVDIKNPKNVRNNCLLIVKKNFIN